MIYCKLVQITRNSRGQAIDEEREIAGDSLRIGRGADCIIHLPDPRIRLNQAVISYADDGKLYLESTDELLNFNGEFRKREALNMGTRVIIGPYLFIVEGKDNEHDVILSYELVQPLSDERTELKKRSRTHLAQTGLSKRFIAIALALLIGTLFLALPILNAINSQLHSSSASLPVALDESWNPGPISAGHKPIATDCQQCHRKPFVRVEDNACTACHKDIGGHVGNPAIQASLFGETRCASCHLEHKSSHAATNSNPALCVDCHGNLKNRLAGSGKIPFDDIHDFSDDHPAFKLSIGTGARGGQIKRISQDDKAALVENSGLKFPHDVHLSAKGINSPDGRLVMQCSNCHSLDEAGVRFKPVSMQMHCASCHRLEFEPAVTTRQVPHGDVGSVMTTLREFYGNQSINESPIDVATIDGLLRRPDQTEAKAQRTRASEWANQKANIIATDLFEVRVCVTCHQITPDKNNHEKPWSITPVNITQQWLPKNNFAHYQHSNTSCATCHDVIKSRQSDDIAIPPISTCRSCHSGATPVRNKVTSTCESCHGFHMPSHQNLSPEQLKVLHTKISAEVTP
ncbi:MAG: cytochrome c3 family protein [Arenimonas sp.]